MTKEYPAKAIARFYDKYSNTVVYEYRGHKYEVEYSNCETFCCTPAWYQHKLAQEKIDEIIENPPVVHENNGPTVQETLDWFFDYIENN